MRGLEPLFELIQLGDSGAKKQNSYKKTHDEESAKGASDTDPMTNLGGQCFVVLLLVFIKIWAQCTGVDVPNDGELNNSSTWRLHEAFQHPFQKMMGQGTQIIFVVAVCDLININVLHSGNLEMIVLIGFVTFVTWVLVGAYFVYHAQNKMMQWYEFERVANDEEQLEVLMEQYRGIYSKLQSVNQLNANKLGKIREKMEYLVLRLIFVNPMSLPSMTESYLRRDFHFAMYLGFCYGKVLTRFFKWSLFSILILFGGVLVVNVAYEVTEDEMIDQLLRFLCFLTAFIFLILMRSCLRQVQKKVIPSVFLAPDELVDPENFNLLLNSNKIDPFFQFVELPRMPYLDVDIENTHLNEDERDLLNDDAEH
mmetsp:Transcript_13312/g.22610  ORF Transcript_13312/g.22610 Transcript_13312/m.22610 type:complete len:367 (-) Transcript_13312:1119-2219(-)